MITFTHPSVSASSLRHHLGGVDYTGTSRHWLRFQQRRTQPSSFLFLSVILYYKHLFSNVSTFLQILCEVSWARKARTSNRKKRRQERLVSTDIFPDDCIFGILVINIKVKSNTLKNIVEILEYPNNEWMNLSQFKGFSPFFLKPAFCLNKQL